MKWAVVFIIASLCLCAVVTAAPAADWPQFRGPTGQGTTLEKDLPVKWSASDNIAWKADLPGGGASTPIIVGDRAFVTCYSGYGPGQPGSDQEKLKRHVVCLKRGDGKVLWSKEIAAKLPEQPKIREDHGYASSTPACDGERLYVFFGKTGVLAFDLDGNELWKADVGSGLNGWGSAASVVLHGNLVIINAVIESKALVALDKKSGKEVWRFRGIGECWHAPILAPGADGKTELVLGQRGKILGVDPATGEQVWSCDNDFGWYVVPSVVVADGVAVCIGGRSNTIAAAVKLGGKGDVTRTHRLWTSTKGSNVSSPIAHEGHLYWMNQDSGIAYCAEIKTGNIVYEERVREAGQTYAAAVLADGKIYYLMRNGRTLVVAAKPKFELLAVNDLDRDVYNSSPAVAGGQVFIRSNKTLYCIGKK